MDTLKTYWNKVVEKWNALSEGNKKLVIILGAIAVITIIASVFLMTRTKYVQLFNGDVDGATLSSVASVLDSNGYKNKISADGNILVDEKVVGKAKLAISGAELPNSKFTWKDAIDTNTLGMTDKDKAKVALLASQDTLASDLESIEGVKSARVNLTLPDDDVFAIKNTKKSQAAVVLTLDRTLSKQQIQAIVTHVRISVQDLEEDNISVVDSNANVLFPFEGSGQTGSLSAYDEIREQRKKKVEEEVKKQLEPMYDDIRVTVNLQMDFDKYVETKEEKSSPLGEDAETGLIQEQHLSSSEGTNKASGGEPGYGSNDEDTTYQVEDTGNSSTSSASESDTVYALNTKTSQLEKEVGTVNLKESSISIIVYQNKDHDYETLNKAKTFKDITWKEYKDKVRSESNKLTIPESMIENIQSATGIQTITINGYVRPIFIEKAAKSAASTWLNVIPLVFLLGIIGFIAFILVKKTSSVKVVETEPELSVEKLLYSTSAKENDLPVIKEHVSESFARISEFVDTKPELVAQLLRNWFNED